MCSSCNKRRQNALRAAQALARGDVKAAAVEAKEFAESSVRDVKELVNGGQGPSAA